MQKNLVEKSLKKNDQTNLNNCKAEGGIMDLGGMEKDYREGGFVPIGAKGKSGRCTS